LFLSCRKNKKGSQPQSEKPASFFSKKAFFNFSTLHESLVSS